MKTQLVRAMLSAALLPACTVAATHTVDIEGMKYSPSTLAVMPGDSIVWRNKDVVPHTVTSAGRFDSAQIAAGGTWSWTARGAGRIGYVCTYHPGMKAEVVLP